MERFKIFSLGLVPYDYAYRYQQEVWEKVYSGELAGSFILCRHEPVITLGRRAKRENILVSPQLLRQKGIALYEVERGGDVTYHGPGQITGYPIINLNLLTKSIRWYLSALERIIIQTLGLFAIKGVGREDTAGVWVDERKIASIGVAIRRWISWHGFTINVQANDLHNFTYIRPCGQDYGMTSMETEIGRSLDMGKVQQILVEEFGKVFTCDLIKS